MSNNPSKVSESNIEIPVQRNYVSSFDEPYFVGTIKDSEVIVGKPILVYTAGGKIDVYTIHNKINTPSSIRNPLAVVDPLAGEAATVQLYNTALDAKKSSEAQGRKAVYMLLSDFHEAGALIQPTDTVKGIYDRFLKLYNFKIIAVFNGLLSKFIEAEKMLKDFKNEYILPSDSLGAIKSTSRTDALNHINQFIINELLTGKHDAELINFSERIDKLDLLLQKIREKNQGLKVIQDFGEVKKNMGMSQKTANNMRRSNFRNFILNFSKTEGIELSDEDIKFITQFQDVIIEQLKSETEG